ncbi:MAG: type II toxin-antitoxin system mRNA interferase toxin, RelE/StbE family [Candidatus Nealsonbacteria bacterium CG_4_10_14_0_2_um_filter_40_15]|uniref:Type II toxin-antitoxin system mRNA interferase toxin, RelE/StbE family n=3 Tax=Parcubacteria group TaxID=1794811 RepID=A0A2M8C1G1_9BACT|nr:MAG: type II toxin-antitoxin system mRNA interferase toxin, RelE/StbE family [Candidatus Nealsonbacteria bacterium CG02_land_8_20_14_3_00_40_11]PIZ87195.1 MAG: type II toxin-antitoxin system mRNA interferase toxin, RelE/StbE family [Candidatus Nealsonbacteria bacterium CG_4_10_14_0_2_um_filter_40_15]PJB49932.1 MAG: type II toxin-antitoxin system mRNA interferase toxin, RelE/StbE family [Candidatus Brennerbacteria bacterium CG_4_9_14_3_um_filter_43_9]
MEYQIKFEPEVKKELAKIPKRYQEKILCILPDLIKNPFQGKKLHGKLEGVYSYRIWPYRITYKIYKNLLLVVILHIGQRQGIYR